MKATFKVRRRKSPERQPVKTEMTRTHGRMKAGYTSDAVRRGATTPRRTFGREAK